MNVQVDESVLKNLAFDYVAEGSLLLEFYGMHDATIPEQVVDFFKTIIQSICTSHGIIFFYNPAEDVKSIKMQHEHFTINYAKDNDQIPRVKLSARLNGWKRIADSFYRGSEVTFIQIGKDLDIIKSSDLI